MQIRGANLFSGHCRRPDATRIAFAGDGWFRTGDIARIDADGFLWIVDRKKDMYLSGGENVYPAAVEAAVAGLVGLAEAAVIGVPDDRWGEVRHLALVGLPGAEITRETVLRHLDGRLARYKWPRHIRILDTLPRNGAGKVVKDRLRALLAEGVLQPGWGRACVIYRASPRPICSRGGCATKSRNELRAGGCISSTGVGEPSPMG